MRCMVRLLSNVEKWELGELLYLSERRDFGPSSVMFFGIRGPCSED